MTVLERKARLIQAIMDDTDEKRVLEVERFYFSNHKLPNHVFIHLKSLIKD